MNSRDASDRQIVIISGARHSGTTLLASLLRGHSDIFVNEKVQIFS